MGRSSLVSLKSTAMTSLDLTFWKSEDSEHVAFGAPNDPEQFDSQKFLRFSGSFVILSAMSHSFQSKQDVFKDHFPRASSFYLVSTQYLTSYFIHMTVIIY